MLNKRVRRFYSRRYVPDNKQEELDFVNDFMLNYLPYIDKTPKEVLADPRINPIIKKHIKRTLDKK